MPSERMLFQPSDYCLLEEPRRFGRGCRGRTMQAWYWDTGSVGRNARALAYAMLYLLQLSGAGPLSAIAPSISPFVHGRPRAVRVSGPVDLVVSNKAVARAGGLAPAGTSELHVDGTRPVREAAHAQARQKLGIVVIWRRQCWVARGAGVSVHSRWRGVDVLLYDTGSAPGHSHGAEPGSVGSEAVRAGRNVRVQVAPTRLAEQRS